MTYRIVNKDKGMVVAQRASVARGFFGRLIGLMFKAGLDERTGLIFYNSPCIHTCFMRFAIDIIFADKNMQVIKNEAESQETI